MKATFRMTAVGVILMLAPAISAAPPMRVALLIDTSAATTSALPQIRAGVSAFLDALPPEHEVLLVTTGRHTQVRVPPTTDRAKLKASAGGLLSDSGPTALMDALTEVDQRFMRKAGQRWPVFVIITGDGSENSKDVDEPAFNRWMTDVARRGVSVNAIVLKASGTGLPEFIASTLVKATHGHFATMGNGAGIAESMTQLAGQLAADFNKR
ncbi:MAG TPA: VWA domain-containing protein [Vicinamibacterales bacterium]|nr:VWA domain-containing protein [Vicinamibacterales bacterium]